MAEYSLDERLEVAFRMQVYNWMGTSALVIWGLEYFQTLHQEITYAWPSPWNAVKILYMSNRYMIVIPLSLCLYTTNAEIGWCHPAFLAACITMMATSGGAETMLILRIWALADRSRRVIILLLVLLLACFSAFFTCFILFFRSMKYATSPARSITRCVLVRSQDKFLSYAFTFVVAQQVVFMTLCIYLGLRRHWGTQSPLVRTFFIDGGIYFVALTSMSIANFLVGHLGTHPSISQLALATYQGLLFTTLTNRMFLNLRETAAEDQGDLATELIARELAILNDITTAVSPSRASVSQSTHPRSRVRAPSIRSRPFTISE